MNCYNRPPKFYNLDKLFLNIYNNYGTKVYSASLPTSDNSIELSNKGFVSGVYYAVVRESGQIVKTLKFIKY